MRTGIIIAFLGVAAALTGYDIFKQCKDWRRKRRKAELRLFWRGEIARLADDLATDPNGWSLENILECLDEAEWKDICHELERMPAGKRFLQRAIEICNREKG